MDISVRTQNLFIFISLVKLIHSHRKYSRKNFFRWRFPKCLEGDYRMYFLCKMCSSSCDLWRWEIKYMGGFGAILDFVRIGMQVAHGQTVLLTTITVLSTSPGGRVHDCMHPAVALYRRLLAKSRDMVQGIIRM